MPSLQLGCSLSVIVYAPGGPIPQNMAKTFDGPPTLERSGSEHRVGRFTSFLLRRKAWLEVELPLERETEGFEKRYCSEEQKNI